MYLSLKAQRAENGAPQQAVYGEYSAPNSPYQSQASSQRTEHLRSDHMQPPQGPCYSSLEVPGHMYRQLPHEPVFQQPHEVSSSMQRSQMLNYPQQHPTPGCMPRLQTPDYWQRHRTPAAGYRRRPKPKPYKHQQASSNRRPRPPKVTVNPQPYQDSGFMQHLQMPYHGQQNQTPVYTRQPQTYGFHAPGYRQRLQVHRYPQKYQAFAFTQRPPFNYTHVVPTDIPSTSDTFWQPPAARGQEAGLGGSNKGKFLLECCKQFSLRMKALCLIGSGRHAFIYRPIFPYQLMSYRSKLLFKDLFLPYQLMSFKSKRVKNDCLNRFIRLCRSVSIDELYVNQ